MNDIKIKNVLNHFLEENQHLYDLNQCNVIIPYKPSGYEDYSNFGYVKGQYNIEDYLTYKRVYTGNDAFIITWKGSTFINAKLDENNQIRTTWTLGEYILGWNEGHSSDIGIEQDQSFSEYKKHSVSNTLTFRIRADLFELNENYKYLFYKVPEVSKDILYRVVSLETEYVGRVKVCYVLTLQSLQQELENTGRAKTQNVMPNAPGQGYVDAKIVENVIESEIPESLKQFYKKIDETRWLTIGESKMVHNPVKKVVLKLFGLALLMNFSLVGRKIHKNDNMSIYGIPRLIFPINFKQATTPTLYRTQNATDNYYFVWGIHPTIQFTKELFGAIKDLFDVNKTWSQQGIVTLPGEPTITDGIANTGIKAQVTNPKESGVFKYTLYGFVTTASDNPFPVHTPWRFNINEDVIGDNKGVFGSDVEYKIKKDTPRIIHDYLWDSYWLNKKILVLPIDQKSTLTFGNVLGSGIQSAFSFNPISIISGAFLFWIGLFGSILTNVPKRTLSNNVCGIFPASLLDFMTAEASVSLPDAVKNTAWFKMSYLLNDEEQNFLTFFNTQTLNTSFEADLTDLFKKNGEIYETTLIGQTQKEDGSNVLNNGEQLLVSGGEELQTIEDENVGFIIDSFNLQAMFSGDFSVEFLDKDNNVVWSGVYQSEAKWTGSIREINTWRNTSIYGRENIFLEEPKPWPAEIKLAPWITAIDKVTKPLNHSQTISYSGDDKKNLVDLISPMKLVENNWPHANPQELVELTGTKNQVDAKPSFKLRYEAPNFNNIELVRSSIPIKEEEFWNHYKHIKLNYKIDGVDKSMIIVDKDNVNFSEEGTGSNLNFCVGWLEKNNQVQQQDGDDPNYYDMSLVVDYEERQPSPDPGGGNIWINRKAIVSPKFEAQKTYTLHLKPQLKFGTQGNAYLDLENIYFEFNYMFDLKEYVENDGWKGNVAERINQKTMKFNLNVDNLCYGKRCVKFDKVVANYGTHWSSIYKENIVLNQSLELVNVELIPK